jgi:hypothetical protein
MLLTLLKNNNQLRARAWMRNAQRKLDRDAPRKKCVDPKIQIALDLDYVVGLKLIAAFMEQFISRERELFSNVLVSVHLTRQQFTGILPRVL